MRLCRSVWPLKIKRVPLLIHEQTFASGLTSRLTSILANKIAVSWPESLVYFPRRKTVLTGNPIRQEFLKLHFRSPSSRQAIYITGGHQGSLVINRAIALILPDLVKRYQVYHQFGLAQDQTTWPEFTHQNYVVKPWFEPQELAQILTPNCLVIQRSGINIVTELAWLNQRAILIPLTTAQPNEQLTNAKFLRSLGLALILPQPKLTSNSLQKAIRVAFKILPQSSQRRLDRSLIRQATAKLFILVKELSYEAEN